MRANLKGHNQQVLEGTWMAFLGCEFQQFPSKRTLIWEDEAEKVRLILQMLIRCSCETVECAFLTFWEHFLVILAIETCFHEFVHTQVIYLQLPPVINSAAHLTPTLWCWWNPFAATSVFYFESVHKTLRNTKDVVSLKSGCLTAAFGWYITHKMVQALSKNHRW